MTNEKLNAVLTNARYGYELQREIVKAFFDWFRRSTPTIVETYHQYPTVDGKNFNIAATAIDGTLTIVYMENFRCFLMYTNRIVYDIVINKSIAVDEIMDNPQLFPDFCFASTAQELAENFEMLYQSNYNSLLDDHKQMSKDDFQAAIDKMLDDGNDTKLDLLQPVISEKLL